MPTNFDIIKSGSAEKLASMLASGCPPLANGGRCGKFLTPKGFADCEKCWCAWLESPAERAYGDENRAY